MLDTLLQIGEIFKRENRLQHHRYISTVAERDRNGTTILSLPVRDDFTFDFDGLGQLGDGYWDSLFYPKFKTSDADSLVKYLFGDIYYGIDPKKGKEFGYYRMANPSVKAKSFQLSSFNRCKDDARFFDEKESVIPRFREEFERHVDKIEGLLKEHAAGGVWLHFDFGGRHWYQFESDLKLINEKMFSDFLGYDEETQGYYLNAFLHKTLGGHSPGFGKSARYKNKSFKSTDDVLSLVYAIDYSKKALITEKNIKIGILPRGKNLSAEDIEGFFEQKVRLARGSQQRAEDKLQASNVDVDDIDSLWGPILAQGTEHIVQFDFVFSKRADSPSTPDVDMIELSGLWRSHLADLGERIRLIRKDIAERRNKAYPKRPKRFIGLDIRNSFLNILGDATKGQKKYQSHLFKVLPKIYAGNYYRDDILLQAFIEKTEFNIRNDQADFNLLKYDFEFLTRIQNIEENRITTMKLSDSYRVGLLLGKMARPLSYKINSFDKNYAGLLSRRISDLPSLIKFSGYINEKLLLHDVAYPDLKDASVELANLVSELDERSYLKSECELGFFQSYFHRDKKDDDSTSTETTNG